MSGFRAIGSRITLHNMHSQRFEGNCEAEIIEIGYRHLKGSQL